MEAAQEHPLQPAGVNHRQENANNDSSSVSNNLRLPQLTHYKWWLRMTCYIFLVLSGQSAATLLGRLYFDEGGNSKWMATFVQSSGFPILLPLLFYFTPLTKSTTANTSRIRAFFATESKLSSLGFIYIGIGLFVTGNNLMYSYGLLYLPVSTYSLLCASQLAFNAVFSFFLNSQKFTVLILNSLVLLTISATLLALNSESENSARVSKGNYITGFLCTIGASAGYSLSLSVIQRCFEKVIRQETFSSVVNMLVFTSFVTTCGCAVGLFASGEWKSLETEMKDYKTGSVSYLMTLIWTAITWQIATMGMMGLIFEISSLFCNVISTLALPIVPILAVVFFHDKMDGIKVISMLLAIWGFLSYIYQHYLDDAKSKESKANVTEHGRAQVEIC